MKLRFLKEENGDALVLLAFLMVIIMGIAGVVIDFGIYYKNKSYLKKACDAAALSGAQEILNSNSAVDNVVHNILASHGVDSCLSGLNITADSTNKIYQLQVGLAKNVPMSFLKLFGVKSIKASAESTAKLVTMSGAAGAVPLGVDESIPLEYMKEYKLKVDSGDSTYGNFGILALSGPGANLYENDLQYGYSGSIKVGDILDTQTGNIEGKTKSAIDYRISSSPYTEGDITHRDDTRILLVLVYKPYSMESNQMKQVQVTDFAYFYIESPLDSSDSSITGYFIERAGSGTGDEGLENKGAYTIKLTE